MRTRIVAPMLTLVLAACGGQAPEVIELASPAGDGSLAPRWSVRPGEAPLISWLEPAGEGYALRYARLLDDSFTAPVTVVTGTDWFANWADTPSVVLLPGGRLAAHWLVKSGPEPYSYDIRYGISTDGGATWSGYFNPHDDGTLTEHGFAQFFPEPAALGAVWLDGRRTGKGGPMTLRYGRFGPRGEMLAQRLLDERVCDCCMTGVARTSAGLVVAYRDRTQDELRDIWRVVRTETGWSEPAPVHADGWRIAACPVNGPAVAANGDRVAVAWFTAVAGRPVVKLAFSDDGGRTFAEPLTVDASDPVGRVDVVMDSDQAAWVSWLDGETDPGLIRLRHFEPDGSTGQVIDVAEVGTGRASGFPVLALDRTRLLLAWTDPDQRSVRVVSMLMGE